jgi:hypothetical protein
MLIPDINKNISSTDEDSSDFEEINNEISNKVFLKNKENENNEENLFNEDYYDLDNHNKNLFSSNNKNNNLQYNNSNISAYNNNNKIYFNSSKNLNKKNQN